MQAVRHKRSRALTDAEVEEAFARGEAGETIGAMADALGVPFRCLKGAMERQDETRYRRLVDAHRHVGGQAGAEKRWQAERAQTRPTAKPKRRGFVFHGREPDAKARAQDARVRHELMARLAASGHFRHWHDGAQQGAPYTPQELQALRAKVHGWVAQGIGRAELVSYTPRNTL